MPMPEAAMDEYGFAAAWKDQIRRAGKLAAMQAEAVAESMDKAADREFRTRILATNPRHSLRAFAF